jgi:hypothetical protein
LRSLSFGDQDYPANVQNVLLQIARQDAAAFNLIEELVN